VEGHRSAAGRILESLFGMFVGDSDRHEAPLKGYVFDTELADLFCPGSGRQEESPAVELVIVSVAVSAPVRPEDSLSGAS
jgi:hypothetical protein